MKKVLSVSLAMFLVVALASQSLAWGKGPRRAKFDREKIMGRIEKKLELTDEQKRKFKVHREKERKEMESHAKEMKAIGDKLRDELEKDKPNREFLHSQIRKMNQKRMEMELRRLDSLLELRKLLTPKQRESFKEMIKKHEKRGPGGLPRPW